MVFIGVYRSVYDYAPQGEDELGLEEGDLLFVLEKSTEDDWWRAKKKAENEDEEEPTGLIPCNYVEEVTPLHSAKALYDYARQTDEELSFSEDAILDVYDISDPDWTLVGLGGEYGFAPANYIQIDEEDAPTARPAQPPSVQTEPEYEQEPERRSVAAAPSPAAALAGIIQSKSNTGRAAPERAAISPPPSMISSRAAQYTPDESPDDEPSPTLPRRPTQQISPPPTHMASPRTPASPEPTPTYERQVQSPASERPDVSSPAGYHLYNIHEMVSSLGKSKKLPMTLGINVPKGTIMIAPERSRDGPQQLWTAEKLTNYSLEGKHVFIELVRPSKSVDFHAGAKDTAHEIVAGLGELAGAARAGGLREVIAAGSGSSNVQKVGHMLYEFMAQGDDEVTVAVDDEVLVLDDTRSEEWWMVRRLKNGKEGVVPSSYVEITGSVPTPGASSGIESSRSPIERNRKEEERLTREAARSKHRKSGSESRANEVGPGLQLPARNSSLMRGDNNAKHSSQRSKRDGRDSKSSSAKTKPDSSKTRMWTDRTGSFRVEAQFIGLRDGKIHLHKLNGVKIAVPVPKMSIEDLEYVEKQTGESLDEDKPLSMIKRGNSDKGAKNGLTIEQRKRKDYDWFDFFLTCGVNPQICERYAASFSKDEMGEENMADISESLLRTLGVKEGDILRVMKYLDGKYGRIGKGAAQDADGDGSNGGLFSGAGGALRNNTRKGRPAPAVATNDVVDPKAFEQKTDASVKQSRGGAGSSVPPTPPMKDNVDGFDDNAWDVKPSKQRERSASTGQSTQARPAQPPTGSAADLSLLSAPLQPTPAPKPAPSQPAVEVSQAPIPAQPTGATTSIFDQIAAVRATQQQQQISAPRQRPQAPQQGPAANALIAPPPQRASSAPLNPQQTGFSGPPPLQAQMTGYPGPPTQFQGQVAPPGQSLQDLAQQRLQQSFPHQQQQLQSQATGFGPQPTGYGPQYGNIQVQQTGYPLQAQPTGYTQQYMNGQQLGAGPFADPPRPAFQPIPSQATGVNAFLPPALQPQQTGVAASQFAAPGGPGGIPQSYGNQQQQAPPPVPPIPQGPAAAPLQPQKTGPAPPVRFGTAPASRLTAQPTGRRANLNAATPQNPFGF